ncbi:MAG: carboxypeptidase-like regulatory domain-containing protein [Planctomycetaceae bacterium]|jgi:hypothetical protein|nr:carboxypeptidase-like regulatory domain-containing protein [Planctomycetaceae bacterium]
MKMRLCLRIFCVLFLFFHFGCGGRVLPRPEGLPVLYPCDITVTFGGVPIRGVRVMLLPQEENKKWKPSGLTNAEGNVELSSSYGYAGVPAGIYTITFSLIQEPDEEETRRGIPPLSLIPLKYSQGKSKEIVEIKPEQNKFTFNLDAGQEQIPRK